MAKITLMIYQCKVINHYLNTKYKICFKFVEYSKFI